uniref:hypothetical protein n=1 Tax=Aerococcus urinaeequi TaxID=51665 RepID=UPI00352B3983
MEISTLIGLMVGTGGIGAILSAYFVRQSSKESHKIELLSKAYEEITRLERNIAELEEKLENKQVENNDLKLLVIELKTVLAKLKMEVQILKGGK